MTANKRKALGSSKDSGNNNCVTSVPTPPPTISGNSSSGENSSDYVPVQNAAISRKANKPLMEKRRRARINESLAVLKEMVVSTEVDKKSNSTAAAAAKLEKADILELTVKHLRELCQAQAKTQELWKNGYNQCLEKTKTFLEMSGNQNIYGNLVNHLDSKVNQEMPFTESSILLSPRSYNSMEELEPEPAEESLNLSMNKPSNPYHPITYNPDEPLNLAIFQDGGRPNHSSTWRPW